MPRLYDPFAGLREPRDPYRLYNPLPDEEPLGPDLGGFPYDSDNIDYGDYPTGDADMGIGLDPVDPEAALAFEREQRYGATLPSVLEPGLLNPPEDMETYLRAGEPVQRPLSRAGILPGMGESSPRGPLDFEPTPMDPATAANPGAPFVKGEEFLPAMGRLLNVAGSAAPPIAAAPFVFTGNAPTVARLAAGALGGDVIDAGDAAVRAAGRIATEANEALPDTLKLAGGSRASQRGQVPVNPLSEMGQGAGDALSPMASGRAASLNAKAISEYGSQIDEGWEPITRQVHDSTALKAAQRELKDMVENRLAEPGIRAKIADLKQQISYANTGMDTLTKPEYRLQSPDGKRVSQPISKSAYDALLEYRTSKQSLPVDPNPSNISNSSPPPTPPRVPDVGPVGDDLLDMGGGASVNAIGTRIDQVTPRPLTKGDRIANTFRSVLRQGSVDEIATPIFLERAEGARRIENLAATFGEQTKAVAAAFTRDKYGRIPDLATPQFPNGPTIQDVAARLPEFDGMLNPKQQGALDWLRTTVGDFRAQLDEVQEAAGTLANRQAKELNTRGDIIEGGFYLPRGRADLEGADVPIKVPSGRSAGAGAGAGGGYKAAAKFDSMADGIEQGYEYADLADAIRSHVKAIGTDINNRATANKMLELVDDNGIRVAQTAADRVDPTLRKAVQQVTGQIAQRRMTALRQNLMANAAGKSTEQAERIMKSATRLADNAEKRLWDRIANGSTDEVIHAAERELLVLRREAAKQARRANEAGTKAALRGAKYLETSEAIDDLSVQLFDLRGKYKHAQDVAKSRPRDMGSIGLPELQGYEFPDVIANAANRELQKEIPLQGKGAGVTKAVNAFNSLSRAFKSTGDNSALGVQGLLGLGADQKAYGQALKVNAKAWLDPKATGEFMVWFDERAAKEGLPAAADWAKSNLHIGGSSTEFSFNRGITQAVQDKIKRIPKVGGTFETVDRAFGAFGDALRLEWANNEMRTMMSRTGKSWQELAPEMDKIAKAMNRQTGYSPARFGQQLGDLGDLVLFAPRFLQARLETVAHALTPTNDLENRLARNALLSTVGYAAVLTTVANQLTGGTDGKGGTDWRPTIKTNDGKTRANPNFMKVRFNDNDWSLLGSWDSLARMFIQVGAAVDPTSTATPIERLKTIPDIMLNLGSATTRDVALAIEMFNKGSANGKPVSSLTPADYAAWVGGHFSPISTGTVIEAAYGTGEAALSGDVGKTIAGAVTTAGQFVGGKASDLAYSDVRDQVAFRMFGKPYADLDRQQEKAVRGDDAVAKREAEFLPTPQTDQQYLEPLFNAAANKKANLEVDLGRNLAAGLKGEAKRKAIQKFKELSYEAGDTVFGSPEAKEALARATVNKSVDIKDQLRDQYWSASVPDKVVDGALEFDRKAVDAIREKVLERAASVGVPADYITTRDYSKYKDPLVREQVKAYDIAQETLRPYWELKDKVYEQMPAAKAAFDKIEAAKQSGKSGIAVDVLRDVYEPVTSLYNATLKRQQQVMRAKDRGNNPVEKALQEWYPQTPIMDIVLK